MFKAIVIILLVVGALVGLIMTLRSTRSAGMPSGEILERAKQREKSQEAIDEDETKR